MAFPWSWVCRLLLRPLRCLLHLPAGHTFMWTVGQFEQAASCRGSAFSAFVQTMNLLFELLPFGAAGFSFLFLSGLEQSPISRLALVLLGFEVVHFFWVVRALSRGRDMRLSRVGGIETAFGQGRFERGRGRFGGPGGSTWRVKIQRCPRLFRRGHRHQHHWGAGFLIPCEGQIKLRPSERRRQSSCCRDDDGTPQRHP